MGYIVALPCGQAHCSCCAGAVSTAFALQWPGLCLGVECWESCYLLQSPLATARSCRLCEQTRTPQARLGGRILCVSCEEILEQTVSAEPQSLPLIFLPLFSGGCGYA